MKKWLIVFCLMIFPAFAQEISNDTFNENNPNIIHNNEPREFNGSSFVYIQGISDKAQPKDWMDEVKLRVFGSMEIPKGPSAPTLSSKSSIDNPDLKNGIQTKNLFGQSKTTKFVTHTSNWDFIIQLMDENTVSIQENIQFILTEEMSLVRSWPIPKEKIAFMRTQIDGKFVSLDKNNRLPQLNFSQLSPGIHRINLQYVVSIPEVQNLILPLTDTNWSLITDNLSGIILAGKLKLEQPHFFLGDNNVEIPQNFTFLTDNQGNIFFKNDHILPPFVQIQLAGKVKNLSPETNEKRSFILNLPISVLGFIIILLYLILSGVEIAFSSLTYLLKRFRRIGKNIFSRWFYRMGEITIGCIILLILIFLTSYLLGSFLSIVDYLSFFILIIVGIITLDRFIFYPKQKMIYKLHKSSHAKEDK